MTIRDLNEEQRAYQAHPYTFIEELRHASRPIYTVLARYGREWTQDQRDQAIGELASLETRAKQLRERLESYFSTSFRVVDQHGRKVLDTDDWVEAQRHVIGNPYNKVLGTHPTHSWGSGSKHGRCINCGAWDNGSYGSQSPCGYNWERSLVAEIVHILEAREAAAAAEQTQESP